MYFYFVALLLLTCGIALSDSVGLK